MYEPYGPWEGPIPSGRVSIELGRRSEESTHFSGTLCVLVPEEEYPDHPMAEYFPFMSVMNPASQQRQHLPPGYVPRFPKGCSLMFPYDLNAMRSDWRIAHDALARQRAALASRLRPHDPLPLAQPPPVSISAHSAIRSAAASTASGRPIRSSRSKLPARFEEFEPVGESSGDDEDNYSDGHQSPSDSDSSSDDGESESDEGDAVSDIGEGGTGKRQRAVRRKKGKKGKKSSKGKGGRRAKRRRTRSPSREGIRTPIPHPGTPPAESDVDHLGPAPAHRRQNGAKRPALGPTDDGSSRRRKRQRREDDEEGGGDGPVQPNDNEDEEDFEERERRRKEKGKGRAPFNSEQEEVGNRQIEPEDAEDEDEDEDEEDEQQRERRRKEKGKGKATNQDEEDQQEGPSSTRGRFSSAHELECERLHQYVEALAQRLGRSPRSILRKAGLAFGFSRDLNAFNIWQAFLKRSPTCPQGCKLFYLTSPLVYWTLLTE